MEQSIFREKSLTRISSPEQLDDYIKVSNPGVWLIVTALIVLLAGIVVWGFWGRIDSTIPCYALCNGGTAYCYIPEEEYIKISQGMEVILQDNRYIISEVRKPAPIGRTVDDYYVHASGLHVGQWAAVAVIENCGEDGVFPAEIIYESVVPASFVMG